ncbi:MAG TPA: hypothetical protein VGF24_07985 [Vicinamibacterales bacterium]
MEIERTPARLWPAAAAVLLVALVWQVLTFNGFPNDHYFHVARARQMLLGAWPIRDFVDPGASLQYVVSAISRWWFGDRIAAELFVVALGVAVGAAATVVAASWLARSTIVGVVVALLEILASPRSYSYPKMLLYGLAGCAIVAVTAHATRARLLLAAGLTAVAFLMRHDHGLFIGAASAAAILLSAPGVTESVKRLSLYAVGVAALLAPWAVWVQYYQGLVPYFRMGIGVSRREADISLMRHLPRLQPFDGLTTENAHAWLFYLFWSLPLICVALAGYRRLTQRERWAGELAAVAGIALLALALDATFLRNPLETRLADATVPAALLGAWLAGLVSTIPLRTAIGVSARTAAAVVLIGTTVAIWRLGDVNGKLDEAGVFDDWDHVREHTRLLLAVIKRPDMEVRKFPSRVSAGLVPFFHYLARCTLPTDRLLVSGSYPDVFVLARRGFAGGQVAFVEALYASDADQALTLSRMRHESVPFVLLVRDEQAAFAGSFPRILAYIDEAYQPMTDVSIAGMQGVRVLVERQRRPTGVDFNTGWPCYR